MKSKQTVNIPPRDSFYLRFGKRTLDILLAATALLLVSPILLICAVAIYLESGKPILYFQWRVGRNGEPFRILKLRTMIRSADTLGPRLTASGDSRITSVGRFLRKAKLDEIPQVLNVIRGQMSIVGPRPELPEYVTKYEPHERKVLELKPGITGSASVAYVDEERILAAAPDREQFYIDHVMRDKLQMDLAYADNVSLLGDFTIILQTVAALFRTPKVFPEQRRIAIKPAGNMSPAAQHAETQTVPSFSTKI